MGFFDRDVRFGEEIFDLNRDGVLDAGEQALEFMALDNIANGRDPWDCDDHSSSSYDEEEAEYEDVLDEIDGMDEEEAREYLESEGFDPDDFDF